MTAALHIAGWVIYYACAVYTLLLLARMVFDWISFFAGGRWEPPSLLVPVLNFIYGVTDPPLRLLRQKIPPLRLGEGFALDVGFIVLFLGVVLLQRLGVFLAYF